MKQAYKKRPPRATANSPPGLADMGGFYFINLENSYMKKVSLIITTNKSITECADTFEGK